MKRIALTILLLSFVLSGCETIDSYPNYATAPMASVALITDVSFSEDIIDEGDNNIDAYSLDEWKNISSAVLDKTKSALMEKQYAVSDTFYTAGISFNALGKDVMQAYFSKDEIETYVPEKITDFKEQLRQLIAELSEYGKQLKEGDVIEAASFLKEITTADQVVIITSFGRDYHGGKEFLSIFSQALLGASMNLQYQTIYSTTDYLASHIFMINPKTSAITYANKPHFKGRWGTGLDEENFIDKALDNVNTLPAR